METELKDILIEEIYRIIFNVADEFVSEKVRLRFEKDIYARLLHVIVKKYPRFPIVTRGLVYKILKSMDILKEDPEKPRDFITYKSKLEKIKSYSPAETIKN